MTSEPEREGRNDGDPTPDVLMVVFKYPLKGLVKTRLASEIGEDKALTVHEALLKYTLDTVARLSAVDVRLFVAWDGAPGELPGLDGFVRKGWAIRRQEGSDLGERLANAFKTVLLEGPRKAVVIGADCIGLDEGALRSAFAALEDHDTVLGPTEDGGYYLLGMKREQDLFNGIPWSTAKVSELTLKRVRDLGLRVQVLPVLYDVDTKQDWARALRDEPALGSMDMGVPTGRGRASR